VRTLVEASQAGAVAVLQQLRRADADITGAVLATADGFAVHSDAAADVDADSLAAMAADLAARAARMSADLGQGKLQEIVAQADGGYILASRVGAEMTLAVMAKAESSLGLLIITVRKAAAQLVEYV
jgi:predicted regulator of Ras-like GTPase activity (Roadblock/LC7/MglB family)